MAQEKSPAFQFYPKEYLSDAKTRAMTFKQRGMYWDLVSHCWLEKGLPSEPDKIARILGLATAQAIRRFVLNDWPQIARCFRLIKTRHGEPMHQHQRLNIERRKQAEFRHDKQKAGRSGGKAKAAKQLEHVRRRSTDVAVLENTASKTGSKPLAKPSSPISDLQVQKDPSDPSSVGGKPHPIRDLLTHYARRFEDTYGLKPQIDGDRDSGMMKGLLRQHTEATVRRALDELFDSADPFVGSSGRTLTFFRSQFNRLLASMVGQRAAAVGRSAIPDADATRAAMQRMKATAGR